MSPVTQTADVEVKRASRKFTRPGSWDQGSSKSRAPRRITTPNLPIRRASGRLKRLAIQCFC
jgi:hypothetical protein